MQNDYVVILVVPNDNMDEVLSRGTWMVLMDVGSNVENVEEVIGLVVIVDVFHYFRIISVVSQIVSI